MTAILHSKLTWAWTAACLTLLCSCSRTPKSGGTEPSGAVTIAGDNIAFPPGAPQLTYLSVEPARERKELATGLTGRLAWNDDVTARIFAPVSGRTVEILANPGQVVQA